MSYDTGKVPAGSWGAVGQSAEMVDQRAKTLREDMEAAALGHIAPRREPTVGEWLTERENSLMATLERVRRMRSAFTEEGLKAPMSVLSSVY